MHPSGEFQPVRSLKREPYVAVEAVALFLKIAFISRPIGIVNEPGCFRGGRILISRTVPCAAGAVRAFIVCQAFIVYLDAAPLKGFVDYIPVIRTAPRSAQGVIMCVIKVT